MKPVEKETFNCAYCDKERPKNESSGIIKFGERVCKMCARLFGMYVIRDVIRVPINKEESH